MQHPTGPAGAAQRTNEKNEKGFAKFASTRTRPGDPRTAMDETTGPRAPAAKSLSSGHTLNCAKSVECCFGYFTAAGMGKRKVQVMEGLGVIIHVISNGPLMV